MGTIKLKDITYIRNDILNKHKLFIGILFTSLLVHLLSLSFTKISLTDSRLDLVPETKTKIKIISVKKKKQIVETNQKENKKKLDNARDAFLSKNNSAVEKATVAKKIGKFNNMNGSSSKTTASQRSQKRKSFSLSDLSLDKNLVEKIKLQKKVEVDNGREKKVVRNSGSLMQSATNDHIKNIPLGDITQLNTTEFKFYGFYHRIKQKLEQHWGNSLRQKAKDLYRSGRRISAQGEKLTALLVILDDKGNILKVKLKSTSGIQELDQAAVESFNKAGPFPNPPKEMLRAGKAFIEWGFVVKT
ncbi:MAG: hypothetical protein CME61_06510 [Halobacteriovoraceae bacterium]|nr:hypothetical protein [Halobacteriovoraceae bacterium]